MWRNTLINNVDSLLNQDFKNYEIILINDGSKDSSRIYVDEYSKTDTYNHASSRKFRSWICRNKGIEIAKGEYLYFWIVMILVG